MHPTNPLGNVPDFIDWCIISSNWNVLEPGAAHTVKETYKQWALQIGHQHSLLKHKTKPTLDLCACSSGKYVLKTQEKK